MKQTLYEKSLANPPTAIDSDKFCFIAINEPVQQVYFSFPANN
nr:hypothetical protein [uncultured Fibrobacter sp.]